MLKRGCVVVSSAGRDKDLPMAVLDTDDASGRALVADGRKRRLEAAKWKNVRHLRETGLAVCEASMATNREIRRALADLAGRIDIT